LRRNVGKTKLQVSMGGEEPTGGKAKLTLGTLPDEKGEKGCRRTGRGGRSDSQRERTVCVKLRGGE